MSDSIWDSFTVCTDATFAVLGGLAAAAAERDLAVHAGDTAKPERSTSTDSASGEAATALSAAKEALMLGLSSSETPASELEVLAAALRKAADACGGAAAGGAEAVVMLGACAARLRRTHVGRAG